MGDKGGYRRKKNRVELQGKNRPLVVSIVLPATRDLRFLKKHYYEGVTNKIGRSQPKRGGFK